MTLSTTSSRTSYAGNGVTTAFAFPYKFLQNSDLVVLLTDNTTGISTTQVLTTNYTVTGAGLDSGGTITMLVAPPAGTTLVIYRDPAQTQDLDLVENDKMPAEEIEKRLDKLTMLGQRTRDLIGRSITLADGFAGNFSAFLPTILTPLNFLRVKSDGTGFDLADIATQGVVGLPSAPGIAAYLGSNNFANRILTAGAGIAISNGDGQVGNPTIALGPDSRDYVIAAKTANFALTTEDMAVGDASGGAFTFTLPAAASRKKPITLKKKVTDTSFNAITIAIAGASGDNIGGASSTTLNTFGETIVLVPDGVNTWYLVSRDYPRVPTAFTIPLSSSGGTATRGTATEFSHWTRNGKFLEIYHSYIQTVAGSMSAGYLLYGLPGSLQIDTTYLTANVDTASGSCGSGRVTANTNTNQQLVDVTAYNATALALIDETGTPVSNTNYSVLNATYRAFFRARIPIVGWN